MTFRVYAFLLGLIVTCGVGCTSAKDNFVIVEHRVPPLVWPQLTNTSAVVGTTPHPISRIKQGIPFVEKVAGRPLVAGSEERGWFFYTTDAGLFISGYAIQKGHSEIFKWSVW